MRRACAALVLVLWAGVAHAQEGEPSRAARIAAGDSAWTRGEHDVAFAAYDAVVREDSTFSRRALVRVGILHSWGNRFREATAALGLAVRLQPADDEARLALARTLSWAQQYAASVAQYDTLLTRTPDSRDAVVGRANVLSWWGRYAPALEALEAWQRLHPDDLEVALQRARVLSWSGGYAAAEQLFDSLRSGAGAAEAEKGSARVKGWRGDLLGAERAWREVLERNPDDVEALVGLGTVLRWQGRIYPARDALLRALELAPNTEEAREGLRWVRAETDWSAGATIVRAEDSERNTLTFIEVSSGRALPRALRIAGAARVKQVALAAGTPRSIPGVSGTLQWQSSAVWGLRAQLGLIQSPDSLTASSAMAFGGARVWVRPWANATVGAGIMRTPFDDIASVAVRRVFLTTTDVDVAVRLHARLTLAADVGRTAATGDLSDNTRVAGGAALRWSPLRGVQAAVSQRNASWDQPEPGVYFAPQTFALSEASLAWFRAADLGLIAAAEVGLGAQTIRFDGAEAQHQNAPRGSLRLGYRVAPGREVAVGLLFANVAAAGALTNSAYRYGSATLTGRWVF